MAPPPSPFFPTVPCLPGRHLPGPSVQDRGDPLPSMASMASMPILLVGVGKSARKELFSHLKNVRAALDIKCDTQCCGGLPSRRSRVGNWIRQAKKRWFRGLVWEGGAVRKNGRFLRPKVGGITGNACRRLVAFQASPGCPPIAAVSWRRSERQLYSVNGPSLWQA